MDKIKVAYHYGESYLIMDKHKDELYTYNDDGEFEVLSENEIDEIQYYDYNQLTKEAQEHVLKCKESFDERKGRTLVTGKIMVEFNVIIDAPSIAVEDMSIVQSDALIKTTINSQLPNGYNATNDIHVDNHKKVF